MSGLYIAGYGYRTGEEIDLDRACKSHDSDLVFKRHPVTNHLTIFQRMQRDSVYVKHADAAELVDGELFPLCAFPNRVPSVEEVHRWLYQNDQMRQDTLEKVDRHNKRLRDQMHKDIQPEIRHRAELLEHGFRMLGQDTGRSVSLPNQGKRRRSFG